MKKIESLEGPRRSPRNRFGVLVLVPVVLFAFAGASLAGTPIPLVTGINQPNGVAAGIDRVLFSRPFCQVNPPAPNPRQIFQLKSDGTVSVFAVLPDLAYDGNYHTTCAENYIAISPGLGKWSSKTGYVYVGQQNTIYQIPPSGSPVTPFITIPGLAPFGHGGLGFDRIGTFGFNLIASGLGGVYLLNAAGKTVDLSGNVTAIQPTSVFSNPAGGFLEGPSVAPKSFPTYGGWLVVGVDGGSGGVYAFPPASCSGPVGFCAVTLVLSPSLVDDAESLDFVPSQLCTFKITRGNRAGSYAYVADVFDNTTAFADPATTFNNGVILGFAPADFTGLTGQLLLQEERDGTITPYSSLGTSPVSGPYFLYLGSQLQESASFVACPGFCPATKGYWKNSRKHPFPAGFAPLTIGSNTYTKSQLLTLLGAPASGGNAVLILGSQFVAALANIAAGAPHSAEVDNAIATATTLLGSLDVTSAFVQSSTPTGQQMTSVASVLDGYNNRFFGSCSKEGFLSR